MYGLGMDLVTRTGTAYPLANRHRPMLGPDRERVAADAAAWYLGGASIRAIANEIGKSYGFVHRLLTQAGVQLRPRGAPSR